MAAFGYAEVTEEELRWPPESIPLSEQSGPVSPLSFQAAEFQLASVFAGPARAVRQIHQPH
jgi:hypothetical protein